MKEVFSLVEDFPDYRVSNYGRVQSRRKSGSWKDMKCPVNSSGYRHVRMVNDTCKKMFKVHRLVAIAFLTNDNTKPCVNHIDSNRQNNRIDNLEWCTHRENSVHAGKNGRLDHSGDKNPMSKLDEFKLLTIATLYNCGIRQSEIAKTYGITRGAVHRFVKGKSWNGFYIKLLESNGETYNSLKEKQDGEA